MENKEGASVEAPFCAPVINIIMQQCLNGAEKRRNSQKLEKFKKSLECYRDK